MSHTLLTADNISVKGHHYKAESYESLSATPENTKIEDAIHLDFTLLINGKLKTFGWSFIIEKPENSTQPFELASWSDWNAISFILSSLGYRINENGVPDEPAFDQKVVRKWINEIMGTKASE